MIKLNLEWGKFKLKFELKKNENNLFKKWKEISMESLAILILLMVVNPPKPSKEFFQILIDFFLKD